MCDTIGDIVGSIPKVKLTDKRGLNLLSQLIGRARKKLWIRERNLTPWMDDNVVKSFEAFLNNSRFEELRLAFYKSDGKSGALSNMRKERPLLYNLLVKHGDKIASGKIILYWWEKGSFEKQHLIISEQDVCVESHFSDSECSCGPACFFFESPGDVRDWQTIYQADLENKKSDNIFREYKKDELADMLPKRSTSTHV